MKGKIRKSHEYRPMGSALLYREMQNGISPGNSNAIPPILWDDVCVCVCIFMFFIVIGNAESSGGQGLVKIIIKINVFQCPGLRHVVPGYNNKTRGSREPDINRKPQFLTNA
jgi:hypothetical protein